MTKCHGRAARILLSAFLALPAARASDSPTGTVTNLVGSSLPALIMRTVNGRYVRTAEIAYPGSEKPNCPKAVLVVVFSRSDCQPCRKELPQLQTVVRASTNSVVRVLVVSLDPLSKQADMERMLQEIGVDLPLLLDPYFVSANKLGVQAIPRTLVVSREGVVVGDLCGKDDAFGERFGAVLRAAGAPVSAEKEQGR